MEDIPVARDIMARPSRAMHPDMDIYQAVDVLIRRDTASAAVVDDENRLVGILTEKDCLRILANAAYACCAALEGGKVADYMSAVTATLAPNMDLFTIATLFLQTDFTHLPVIEKDELVGCVSRRRMLRAILEMEHLGASRKAQAEAFREMVEHPDSLGRIMKVVAGQKKSQLASLFSKRHVRPGGKGSRGH